MDIWFFFWVGLMLCLMLATLIAALREKKARDSAMAKMQPQPLGNEGDQAMMPAGDDFGAAPAGDGFGDAADPMAGFDFDNK